MEDKIESIWGLLEPFWPCRGLNLLVLGKSREIAEEMWKCPHREKNKMCAHLQEAFSVWNRSWEALSLLSESHPLIFSSDN